MKTNIIISITMLVFLTNCVSTKIVPLNIEPASMKGKSIVIISDNKKPNFAAMTFKNMNISAFTGGILGTILTIRDGNKIIRENDVEDPAIFIANNLSDSLKSEYGIKIVKADDNMVNHKSEDYTLEVRTVNWSIGYLPFRIDNFKVLYSSKLRLIDIKNSKTIAEGFCANDSSIRNNNAPSYEQLIDNKAKALKENLSQSAHKCLSLFKEKVFNLSVNDQIKAQQ